MVNNNTNNMITEDYVSFEVAKLLKEKGFNSDSKAYYIMYADGTHKFYISQAYPLGFDYNNNEEFEVSAPTHQMAMKWLREAKGIYITIGHGDYPSLKKHFFIPTIEDLESVYGVDDEEVTQEFDTYEEACEAAIKYCLENLI